jgi:drug/metabolite transporter (DMT)-like permease
MFILAGIVGTMLGRTSYFVSVSKIGASRSDAVKASQPLHTTSIALLVLGETLTAEHPVGIVAITIGVAVVSLDLKSDQSGTVPT